MAQSESSDFQTESFNNYAESDIEYQNTSRDSKDSITEFNSNSEDAAEKELLARLHRVLQLQKSSVGLHFASTQILNDWEKLDEIGLHLGDWTIYLSNLIRRVMQENDMETDRMQTKALRNPILKLVSKNPSYEYSATQKNFILAIRGLVIYQALLENKKPGVEFTKSLTKLFDKKSEFEEISNLNITSIKEYVPGNIDDDHVVLLCTLKKLFSKPLVDLANFERPKKELSIQTVQVIDNHSLTKELHDTEGSEGKGGGEKYKTDLINYITYCQQFMGEKENVGIIERYNYVQKFEIEIVIPQIVEDLNDVKLRKPALATLLTFLLHCRPKRFDLIGLLPTSTTTAWVDLKDGCYCWELNAVTEKTVKEAQNKTVVRIPLPKEIVSFMRGLFEQLNKSAVNLGDIFDCDLNELDAECKQYLKSKSLSTHRLTISKLEASYSRYILSHIDDEVYAAVIGLDFCVGTTSNFNYCVIRGSKISKILINVYSKLGFVEQVITPLKDVGSKVGLSYEKVWDLAESLSVKAHQTILAVPKNLSYQNLIQAHNDLATSVGTLTAIFTGHRAAEAYGYARHTIDLERKLCIICDKRVTDYQWARAVPIPTIIASWLEFYTNWLKSMKYRLSASNKNLAFRFESALHSTSEKSHPLFFTIANNQIKPFSSKDFAVDADDYELPTNCGRHFIDYLLRTGELDSALVMAFEGHANLGQEAFGATSLMKLVNVADKIRNVIDCEIEIKKLMPPPKFNPRHIDYKELRLPKNIFLNLIKEKYEIKNPSASQCPFEEGSFEYLNEIHQHQKKWEALDGDVTLIDLVYSLCLTDGVASKEELYGVINKIILHEVHLLDESFYVDAISSKLGVRRVWISYGSLLIASALAEALDEFQLKLKLNDKTLRTFYESLLNSVVSHYSVYAPGMLAAWVRGDISSRTIRPETLARHHFKCVEKPNFDLVESRRAQVILDDDLIRKAINKSSDNSQYIGTNETRLKNLLEDISNLLNYQIDDLTTQILAKFTKYLIGLGLATSTISRYYSVIRMFIDYFIDDIEEINQLGQVDWADVIKNWVNTERVDSDAGPETAAVNNFLAFVKADLKVKGSASDINSAVTEYADFPSEMEISRAFKLIKNNLEIDDGTKLKAMVMLGLLAQYALRPSETRSIRLCDVYLENPLHFVISSEATGRVKTVNANRVLLLKEDDLLTKQNLIKLCHLRKGLSIDAYLFGDNVDGKTLDGSQIIFNIVHDALLNATGRRISIMSLRQFNASRDINLAISESGVSALKDRKITSVIAANSGHGHVRTTLQNYCCDLDKQRLQFWNKHSNSQNIIAPISNIKKRIGLNFRGNLPTNHPSYLLLMEVIRNQFTKTLNRIKASQDYILKDVLFLASSKESGCMQIVSRYRYCFYKLSNANAELAVFESNILQHEKTILDEGYKYLQDTLNKDWSDPGLDVFRSIVHSSEFSKYISILKTIPIDHKDAIQIVQAINGLNEKWEIINLQVLDYLERHLPIFLAANINIEISVNKNLEVGLRKMLRNKPFIHFLERPLKKNVFCEISFWNTNMKNSLRAKHHQEIMVQVNLIFITRAISILGEINA